MHFLQVGRTLAVVSVLALAPLSAGGQDAGGSDELTQELVTIEKSLWEAWQKRDSAPFAQYLHPDFVSVTEAGSMSGRGPAIASITGSNCQVSSYSIGGWRALPLGGDTAMLFYSASQNVTCDGEKLPSRVRCSSVYVRHEGGWKVAAYQETRMK